MDCALDQHLIEGYIDGELGFERALEVEAHVASCSVCSSRITNWKEMRDAIQRSGLYHRVPASTEERIRQLVASNPSKGSTRKEARSVRPTDAFRRWVWAFGGAAFASAALLLVFFLARPPAASPDQEIVASHIRSLMPDHLMDVVSTDQHTVKPWFDGKIEFAPPVRDFAAEGYPLAGGRLDYVEGHKVAALVYHRALHVINLYVWPAQTGAASSVETQTIQGYNVLAWRKDGFEFRAVSDLNIPELRDFARLVSP